MVSSLMAATVRLCLCAGPSRKFSSLSHRCRIWVCGSTGRYVHDVARSYRDAWFGWNAELGEKQKDRKMKKNYLAKINRHRPALRIDRQSPPTCYTLTQLGARQPAALASASEQNQRSPLPLFIFVLSYHFDPGMW